MALCGVGRREGRSCLDSVKGFFVGEGSIFNDKKGANYFIHRDNAVNHFLKYTNFIDKIQKLADPVFEAAYEIRNDQGASKEELQTILNGRNFVKTARDAFSVLAPLSAIPNIIIPLRAAAGIMQNLNTALDEPYKVPSSLFEVPPQVEGKPRNPASALATRAEKIVMLFKNLLSAIANMALFVAFALCRQIANFEKYVVKAQWKIDPVASDIAKSFTTVMTINHAAGGAASVLGIAHELMAYDRAVEAIKKTETTIYGTAEYVFSQTAGKVFDNAVSAATKGLELCNDIMHHVGYAMPKEARIAVSIIVGVGSLYSALPTGK